MPRIFTSPGAIPCVLLAWFISGCSSFQDAQHLAWLETADAQRDAQAAITRGDFRFYAVNGVAAGMVPGIDEAGKDRRFVRTYGKRGIVGTSDYRGNHRLNELAWKYASAYNRLLVCYLRLHHRKA